MAAGEQAAPMRILGTALRAGRSPVLFAILVALILLFASLLVIYLSDQSRNVTLSARASTGVVSWTIGARPEDPFVIDLPAGVLTRFDFDQLSEEYHFDEQTGVYRYSERGALSTKIVIHQNAQVTITTEATLRSVTIEISDPPVEFASPENTEPFVEVYSGGELTPHMAPPFSLTLSCMDSENSSGDCLRNNTAHILIETDRLLIGRHLTESNTTPTEKPYIFTPRLISGDLTAVNSGFFNNRRHLLASETLDPGDEVIIEPEHGRKPQPENGESDTQEDERKVRGMAQLEWPVEGEPFVSVVAHTNDDNIAVTHFGGGYEFGVSNWKAFSSDPFVQSSTAFFIGLLALLNSIGYFYDWRRDRNDDDREVEEGSPVTETPSRHSVTAGHEEEIADQPKGHENGEQPNDAQVRSDKTSAPKGAIAGGGADGFVSAAE